MKALHSCGQLFGQSFQHNTVTFCHMVHYVHYLLLTEHFHFKQISLKNEKVAKYILWPLIFLGNLYFVENTGEEIINKKSQVKSK